MNYEWTRVKLTNGEEGWVKTKNGRALEFSGDNFRVYREPNEKSHSFMSSKVDKLYSGPELDEIVITGTNPIRLIIPEFLTTNQARLRHATIAQAYFDEAPTVPNIYNGVVNWLKSKGILEPEGTGYITGDPPPIVIANPFNLTRVTNKNFRFTGTQQSFPGVKFRGIVPKDEGNPLEIRMKRMELRRKLKETDPETYKLVYEELNPFNLPELQITTKNIIRTNDIRKAMYDIDPTLSDVDIDMGILIVNANRAGVHFDIGNKSGETVGGVNVVDIHDAVNLVRKLNGRKAIPYDISMIAGHEYGHGVQLPQQAIDAVMGYYDPYEFYTQAGLILDDAKIINTTINPVSFNKFMNLVNSYLKKGNLNNGISQLKSYLESLSPILRQIVMKNINRFSAGLFGSYLIGVKNGKQGTVL